MWAQPGLLSLPTSTLLPCKSAYWCHKNQFPTLLGLKDSTMKRLLPLRGSPPSSVLSRTIATARESQSQEIVFLPRGRRSLSIPRHCLKPHGALNSKQSGKFHFHVYPGGCSCVLTHRAPPSRATPFTKILFALVSSHQNISITKSGPLVCFVHCPTHRSENSDSWWILVEQTNNNAGMFQKAMSDARGIGCLT